MLLLKVLILNLGNSEVSHLNSSFKFITEPSSKMNHRICAHQTPPKERNAALTVRKPCALPAHVVFLLWGLPQGGSKQAPRTNAAGSTLGSSAFLQEERAEVSQGSYLRWPSLSVQLQD